MIEYHHFRDIVCLYFNQDIMYTTLQFLLLLHSFHTVVDSFLTHSIPFNSHPTE